MTHGHSTFILSRDWGEEVSDLRPTCARIWPLYVNSRRRGTGEENGEARRARRLPRSWCLEKCPHGDSNPGLGLERAASWSSRRWGRAGAKFYHRSIAGNCSPARLARKSMCSQQIRPFQFTPTPLPPSETPPDTPTITLTGTLGPPTFTTSVNANCRTGPRLMYEVVRVVMAGTSEGIMGRDAGSTWWVIQGEASCWISNVTGTASGDLSGVPVIPAPPTPTPTRTPTATTTPTPTVFILLPPIIRTIWIPPIPLVSSAAVTVDRTTCMPCPCRATWSGVVSATGPLTAEYIWQTKTGSGPWRDTGQFGSLIFPGAETLSAVDFGQESPGYGETVSARLHVTAPNSVYSNEVSVRYCAP